MIIENGNLCNQAADQCLVKLRDSGRLTFDEILQVPDLLHLFIFDDAVHLSLSALIPEPDMKIIDALENFGGSGLDPDKVDS